MTTRVLHLGLMGAVLDDVQQQVQLSDIAFVGGTGVDNIYRL